MFLKLLFILLLFSPVTINVTARKPGDDVAMPEVIIRADNDITNPVVSNALPAWIAWGRLISVKYGHLPKSTH